MCCSIVLCSCGWQCRDPDLVNLPKASWLRPDSLSDIAVHVVYTYLTGGIQDFRISECHNYSTWSTYSTRWFVALSHQMSRTNGVSTCKGLIYNIHLIHCIIYNSKKTCCNMLDFVLLTLFHAIVVIITNTETKFGNYNIMTVIKPLNTYFIIHCGYCLLQVFLTQFTHSKMIQHQCNAIFWFTFFPFEFWVWATMMVIKTEASLLLRLLV